MNKVKYFLAKITILMKFNSTYQKITITFAFRKPIYTHLKRGKTC